MPGSKNNRIPSVDELAGMNWWNGLSEAEREAALKAAGWTPRGDATPSVADA